MTPTIITINAINRNNERSKPRSRIPMRSVIKGYELPIGAATPRGPIVSDRTKDIYAIVEEAALIATMRIGTIRLNGMPYHTMTGKSRRTFTNWIIETVRAASVCCPLFPAT
jgi:hypothetical protein